MARDFNGTSDLINVGDLQPAYPFSFGCWFQDDLDGTFIGAGSLIALDNTANNNRFVLGTGQGAGIGPWPRVLLASSNLTNGTGSFARGMVDVGDGQWHHGVAVFAAHNDRRIYTDGGDKIVDTVSIMNPPATSTWALTFGKRANGTAPFNGRIAEAGVWTVALTDEEVLALARRVPPHRIRPSALLDVWRLIGRRSPEPSRKGLYPGTLTGTAWARHAPMRGHAPAAMMVGLSPPTRGYKIFVAANRSPDALTDTPVKIIRAPASSVSLDAAALALDAESQMTLGVLAFNETGPAVSMAEVSFRTDEAGLPLTTPTPVFGLQAVALAGGLVFVQWRYVEPNMPLGLATEFDVEIDGGVVGTVEGGGTQFSFTTEALADGPHEVKVYAVNAAGYEPDVMMVVVTADAAPPAASALELEAV